MDADSVAALAGLVAEVAALGPVQQVDRLKSLDMQMRALEAEAAVVVDALHSSKAHLCDRHGSVRALLRAELRWSDAEITHRQRTAKLLADMPGVVAAMGAGAVGVSQARLLARVRANPRCGQLLPADSELMVGLAGTLSFYDFELCARRWEQLADEDGAHRDAEATHQRRYASLVERDGVGYLVGQGGALDTAEMNEIWQRFCDAEFAADWEAAVSEIGNGATGADMPRNGAQRRWDALCQIFRAAASTPIDAQRPESTVNILIDVETFEDALARMRLIPLRDESPIPTVRSATTNVRRCETVDGALVTASEAVMAALHGHVRRVVFDSAGNVIDLGRRRRLFAGAAREAVRLQAPRCTWPGCCITAGHCNADHTTDWQHGGNTRPTNGGPLCPKHDRAKNDGYRVFRDHAGRWHTYRPNGTEIGAAAILSRG
ncbi:hypothetical protein BH10ACT2_BH10ACT2_07670 [soil metagenome]